VLDFWQTYRAVPLHQAATELSQLSKTSNQASA
jgi:hypothetical protein